MYKIETFAGPVTAGGEKIRDATFGFEVYLRDRQRDDQVYGARRPWRRGLHLGPLGKHNPALDEGGAGSPAVGYERNGIFF